MSMTVLLALRMAQAAVQGQWGVLRPVAGVKAEVAQSPLLSHDTIMGVACPPEGSQFVIGCNACHHGDEIIQSLLNNLQKCNKNIIKSVYFESLNCQLSIFQIRNYGNLLNLISIPPLRLFTT